MNLSATMGPSTSRGAAPARADAATAVAPQPLVQTRSSAVARPLLQRQCACGGSGGASGECDECRKRKLVQRHASGVARGEVPGLVHDVLASPGRPLDAETRAFFEPRFGHDFSRVRIHDDARAAASATAVSALAYTVANHVVWGDGSRPPGSAAGRALLAHELAHVRQQRDVHSVPASLEVSDDPALEAEAERASLGLAVSSPEGAFSNAGLQRQSIEGARETAGRAWTRAEGLADRASDWLGRQADRAERVAGRAGDWAERQAGDAQEEAARWWGSGSGAVTGMHFNGSRLEVQGTPSLSVRAVSGLLPNHPSAHGVDMTQPSFQNVEGQGPIPEGSYYVDPQEVEHNPPGRFNTGAWGRHRVRIHETVATALQRRWIGRTGGFFLHQDANSNGTAGCIGIVSAADNARVASLVEANAARIPITVSYPAPATPAAPAAAGGGSTAASPGTERGSAPGRVARARPGTLSRRARRDADHERIPRRPWLAGQAGEPRGSSGGSPLDAASRGYFESWFGRGLGDVRVHTDAASAHHAAELQAAAFTLGRDIFFGTGHYAPQTLRGRWVLAHELVHVAQQSGRHGRPGELPAGRVSTPGESHEREATTLASQALSGVPRGPVGLSHASPFVIHPVHPGLIAAGVVAAIAACAYGFYRHALGHYSGRQGYNDKFMHCYTSCKIASWCGGGPIGPGLVNGLVISEVLGILKEVADYIKNELHIGTPADASWEDWIADQYGLLCALNTFGSCHDCCRSAPGAVSPGATSAAAPAAGGTP